jgi:hypothetical protein
MLQLSEAHGVPYSTHGGEAVPQFYVSDASQAGASK